jgi:hypothetical protein
MKVLHVLILLGLKKDVQRLPYSFHLKNEKRKMCNTNSYTNVAPMRILIIAFCKVRNPPVALPVQELKFLK